MNKLTKEQQTILLMYGKLARWEKNALFILLQGLAFGGLSAKTTDSMEWPEVRRMLGLPRK